MNTFSTLTTSLVLALVAATSHAHVTLAEPAALAGTSYRATLRVGHGCEGSPVTALRVSIPAGFTGAKPMPKAGWLLSLKTGKLDKPYDDHGKLISEGLLEVTWTAASKDMWLQDSYFDEFVLRGKLPTQAGPLWFKVLQTCEQGSLDWAQIPEAGKTVARPAALLDIIESGPASANGHAH